MAHRIFAEAHGLLSSCGTRALEYTDSELLRGMALVVLQHVGSQFPHQGFNLCSQAVEGQSLNHWTAREVPKLFQFVNIINLLNTI